MANAEQSTPKRYRRLTVIALALMLFVSALIIVLDWKEVKQLADNADWRFVVIAAAFTAASYVCASASLVVMLRVFHVRLDRNYLFQVGLVSNVLENLIAHPVGLSLKLLVLGRSGVNSRQTLGSSILLSYFKNFVSYSLVPISLIYIIFSYPLVFGGALIITLIIGVMAVVIALATIVILNERVRAFVLRVVAHVWHLLTHRSIEAPLSQFRTSLTEAISELRQHRAMRLPLIGLILGDVAATIISLWFCFAALRVPVHLGVLITGFNFGITLTVISFIPGDLGVQEASMAAVFALFGVPFGHGVLVAILFRVIYYFLPFVFSLGSYWSLLRQGDNPGRLSGVQRKEVQNR